MPWLLLNLPSFAVAPHTLHVVFDDATEQIIDFEPVLRGELAICVARQEETDNDILLQSSVRDTRIGISENKRRTIFDAFTQADRSTTRKSGGTDLDLAIPLDRDDGRPNLVGKRTESERHFT